MTESGERVLGLTRVEGTADWDRTYREHAAALARYLSRLARDAGTGEELMQECFARAIRHGTFPTADKDAKRWLYRIATNLAIDHLRRQRLIRFLPLVGEWIAPLGDAGTGDLVRRTLRDLPPEQATALVLRLHEGFSVREIGQMQGASETAVKQRLARGRLRFIEIYRRAGGAL